MSSILEELIFVLDKYGQVDEIDFKNVTPEVMQFHSDVEGLVYKSDRILIIEKNLGVAV